MGLERCSRTRRRSAESASPRFLTGEVGLLTTFDSHVPSWNRQLPSRLSRCDSITELLGGHAVVTCRRVLGALLPGGNPRSRPSTPCNHLVQGLRAGARLPRLYVIRRRSSRFDPNGRGGEAELTPRDQFPVLSGDFLNQPETGWPTETLGRWRQGELRRRRRRAGRRWWRLDAGKRRSETCS